MPEFTLTLYQIEPGTCVKIGLGRLTFEAADETEAIARAHALYPERLTDCDYAEITGSDETPVWEKSNAA